MLLYTPIKQQSQASKQQRVENMIGDLRLLAYLSILEPQVGFHWLTAVSKEKPQEIKPTDPQLVERQAIILERQQHLSLL